MENQLQGGMSMTKLIIRAGRALKYQVINRSERYGVKHSIGWISAEKITGATIAEVEKKITEILGPKIHALSIDRITAGYRLPENFGDQMWHYLRRDFTIIDRATGKSVAEKSLLLLMLPMAGLMNLKPRARCH
jgi:hypothetical protein